MSDLQVPSRLADLIDGASGLWQIGGSGMRILPQHIVSLSTGALGAGIERAIPIIIPRLTTYDRIGAEVTTAAAAGATVRLGIRDILATGLPGALLLDAGAIDSTVVAFQEIAIARALGPGIYYLSVLPLGANATLRTFSTSGNPIASISATPTANLCHGYTGQSGLAALQPNFGAPTADSISVPLASLRIQ